MTLIHFRIDTLALNIGGGKNVAGISSSERGSNQVGKIAAYYLRSRFQPLSNPRRVMVHRCNLIAAPSSPLSKGLFPARISYRRHSPRLRVRRVKAHPSSQSSDRRSQLPCLLFPEVPSRASSAPESSVSKSSRSQFTPVFNRLGSFCGLAAKFLQFGLHSFLFSLVALYFKHLRPTMQCIGPAGCSRLLPEAKVAPTHRSADRRRYMED